MQLSLPISLALAGLDAAPAGASAGGSPTDRGPEVRAMIAWARSMGVQAVQLNAATPGVRPRDLDRSGRRDLAATLRREGLACSGLDLWIPPEHFADPAHADRAVASVIAAVELARDLAALAAGSVARPAAQTATLAVSLVLPPKLAADALGTMAAAGHARGVRIADHAWPPRDAEHGADLPGLGVGIDPAVLMARGEDPAGAAARLGSRVASARLSDTPRSGTLGGVGGRIAPGSRGGGLDMLAYSVSLVTGGYAGYLVLDLRGVPMQAEAVRGVTEALP